MNFHVYLHSLLFAQEKIARMVYFSNGILNLISGWLVFRLSNKPKQCFTIIATCVTLKTKCWHSAWGPCLWETTIYNTHVKISHLVTSLPTSRQQDVLALLVTSCQQVWNNLLTTCNNLVEIIRLVARLFWQVCYMLDITRLLQPCVVNLVTSLLYHGCNKLVTVL
jgi:hypothetical protein